MSPLSPLLTFTNTFTPVSLTLAFEVCLLGKAGRSLSLPSAHHIYPFSTHFPVPSFVDASISSRISNRHRRQEKLEKHYVALSIHSCHQYLPFSLLCPVPSACLIDAGILPLIFTCAVRVGKARKRFGCDVCTLRSTVFTLFSPLSRAVSLFC